MLERAKIISLLLACMASAASFAQTRTITVPKADVVSAYNDIFQTMELVIDNYGSKKKSEWYRQQSFMRLPTGEKTRFDIPRLYLVLQIGPQIKRYWHYYINELELDRVRVTAADKGVKVKLEFESQGNEIKGKCTRRSLNGKDNCEYRGERDIQLDNARLTMNLRPAVVNGRLGYAPLSGAMAFDADVKIPTKACRRLRALSWVSYAMGGFLESFALGLDSNACEVVKKSAVEGLKRSVAKRLQSAFNKPQVRREMARMLNDKLGIKLRKGEKLVAVKEQGNKVMLTVQLPARMPTPDKPKVKPKEVKLGSLVGIEQFEAHPKVLMGKCPGKISFKGRIYSKVTGPVKYYFENDRGVRSGVYTLHFDKPGSQPVVDWSIGVDRPKTGKKLAAQANGHAGKKSRYEVEGVQKLVVLSKPKNIIRTAEYKVDCDKPKAFRIKRLQQGGQ